MSATAVTVTGLRKSYGGRGTPPALRGLDLEVPPGSLTALLGPSGCGKTTTLRIVAGLLTPDGGDVSFDGVSVLALPAEKRPVGMVFQKPLLFPHLSVGDNVAFGLRMKRVERSQRRERVARMLQLVQLADLAGRRVGQMSGGQEQRVALARALVVQPQVLLLDEPFSQLDAALRDDMRELVRDLQQQLQVTTLFVTHDQQEAVGLADQVALVRDGTVHQAGPPQQFYDAPASVEVARFFGCRNEIPGQVLDGRYTGAVGMVGVDLPDGPAVAVVRQERLILGSGPLRARVLSRRFLGTHTCLDLELPEGVRLQASTVDPPTADADGWLSFGVPPDAVTVFPQSPPPSGPSTRESTA